MNDGKILQVVLGTVFVAFIGFQGWVATEISGTNERLTKIETTMAENRAEREAQIADLRSRVGRIEDRLGDYGRRQERE